MLVLSDQSDHRAWWRPSSPGVRGWASHGLHLRETLDSGTRGRERTHGPVPRRRRAAGLPPARRDPGGAPCQRRDFVSDLSPREYEVLRCLVAGMTKKEIAQRLYLSVNTVRTHVQHLLRAADENTHRPWWQRPARLDVTGIDDGR